MIAATGLRSLTHCDNALDPDCRQCHAQTPRKWSLSSE
jgi:hypothetical protein